MSSSWPFFAQGLMTIVLLCINDGVAVAVAVADASEYRRPGPSPIVLSKHTQPDSYPQQVNDDLPTAY
jgi:hypothetical protein